MFTGEWLWTSFVLRAFKKKRTFLLSSTLVLLNTNRCERKEMDGEPIPPTVTDLAATASLGFLLFFPEKHG
jgi:hypothetical protein